jgi:hypothetical protein
MIQKYGNYCYLMQARIQKMQDAQTKLEGKCIYLNNACTPTTAKVPVAHSIITANNIPPSKRHKIHFLNSKEWLPLLLKDNYHLLSKVC